MKWIKLSRPDDVPVWINAKQIEAVTVPIEGEGPAVAQAVVTTTSGKRWLVRETVRDVLGGRS